MSAPVNYRETVITYLRAETTQEAAKNLGVSTQTLASRLNVLRKAGVKLPRKSQRQGLSQLQVAQLNSLINKHLKEDN